VHASGLIDQIKEGDDVTFELQEGKKGLNAVKVKLA
jgi:cold shock protein